jgi:hypothetical protein
VFRLSNRIFTTGEVSALTNLAALDTLKPMAKHSSHILDLARRGAEARLQDLVMEAKLLIQLFPHLKDSFDKDELPISFIVKRDSGRLRKGKFARRRKGMSAAARKAVGLRMKKSLAAKRRAKNA